MAATAIIKNNEVKLDPSAERLLGRLSEVPLKKQKLALLRAAERFLRAPLVHHHQPLVLSISLELSWEGASVRVLFVENSPEDAAWADALLDTPAAALLSPMERTVACGVVTGSPLRPVAQSANISHETARGYLKSVYRKLGVRSRAQLAQLLMG